MKTLFVAGIALLAEAAAELLGKRYGLFSEKDPGSKPKAELAAEIEAAMRGLHGS